MHQIIKEELSKLSGVKRIVAVPIFYLTAGISLVVGYVEGYAERFSDAIKRT